MSEADLVAAMRGRHKRRLGPSPLGGYCGFDGKTWPCDAIQLTDEVENLRTQNVRLHARIRQLYLASDEGRFARSVDKELHLEVDDG